MEIIAFQRQQQGTGASRRLRKAGRTTGIVYGGTEKPQLIELDHNTLWYALKKETFHSSILDLKIDGKSQSVLLRDTQYHPFRQIVLHVDFQRIDANTKIRTKVPLHFLNGEISPAVKTGGALISHIVNEIEIECLPSVLPSFIEVDLAKLEASDSIHAKDLVLPKGVAFASAEEAEDIVIATAVKPETSAETEEKAEGDGEAPKN